MAERRAEGVRLLQASEMSQVQIARHRRISEVTISKWKKVLEQSDPSGMQTRKASGRPPKLSAAGKTEVGPKTGARSSDRRVCDFSVDPSPAAESDYARIRSALSSRLHQPVVACIRLECTKTGPARHQTRLRVEPGLAQDKKSAAARGRDRL